MAIKKKATFILFTLCTFLIVVASYVLYASSMNEFATKNSLEQLSNTNELVKNGLTEKLETHLQGLQQISKNIPEGKKNSTEQIISTLPTNYGFLFDTISFVPKEGKLDGIDFKQEPFFQASIKGESFVFEKNKEELITSTPVYKNTEIIGVLWGKSSLQKTVHSIGELSTSSGLSWIIADEKEKILHLSNSEKYPLDEATFSKLIFQPFPLASLDSLNPHKNIVIGTLDGKLSHYLISDPIPFTNWTQYTLIPAEKITRFALEGNSSAVLALGMVVIFFTLILVQILAKRHTLMLDLERLAYIDPITNTPNFEKFKLEANQILGKSKDSYAIIYFDILKFKVLNDIYGHNEGNQVLKHIMEKGSCLMELEEFMARCSADNFVFLMKVNDAETVKNRLDLFVASARSYYASEDTPYNLEFVFGIYMIPPEETDINTCCDKAIYANKNAKTSKKVQYSFYSDSIRQNILQEKEIENNMELALKQQQFKVFLQPKVDFSTNKYIGAEALIRWIHPEHGIVPPNHFVPLFEKNGFIEKIDLFVFEKCCALLRHWLDMGMTPLPISVNISKVYIFKKNLPQRLRSIADSYNVPTNLLEIELTESVVFDNSALLLDILVTLKKLGFLVSMDDFGAGYSSLNMLKDIPVDTIKLDRVFITHVKDKKRCQSIIKGIIIIAKELEIKVIAEGIETPDQVEFLHHVGCNHGQGFLFAKPIPFDEFETLVFKKDKKSLDTIEKL